MVADTIHDQGESVAGETAELVRQLGGPLAVGRALGVSTQAVCMWYQRGISPRFHAAVWRLANAKGVHWTPPGFEGVRLLPVDDPHGHDHNVNIVPADRENTVKAAGAA